MKYLIVEALSPADFQSLKNENLTVVHFKQDDRTSTQTNATLNLRRLKLVKKYMCCTFSKTNVTFLGWHQKKEPQMAQLLATNTLRIGFPLKKSAFVF